MSTPGGRPIAFLQASWRSPSRRNLIYTIGAGLAIQVMLVVTGPFVSRLLAEMMTGADWGPSIRSRYGSNAWAGT